MGKTMVGRIERLAFEERDAVKRSDWAAARRAAVKRATLKKTWQLAAAQMRWS